MAKPFKFKYICDHYPSYFEFVKRICNLKGSLIIQGPNHTTSYLCPRGRTHTVGAKKKLT